MPQTNMTVDDLRWQAEQDARSLANAEEVKSDSARLSRANAALQKMVKDKEEETAALKKAAGKSKPQKTTNASTPRKPSNSTPKTEKSKPSNPQRPSWQNR